MFQRLLMPHSKNHLISLTSIFSPRFLHNSQLLNRDEKKDIGNEESSFETPPKSDTIVPTPLASAFRNMFDDSAIRTTTLIKAIKKDGFVTTDNVYLRGPVLLLNGYAFLWDVPQGKEYNYSLPFENWTPECLKIFEVIVPKPEMIIFGTGKTLLPLPQSLRDYVHRLGMQLDMMSTSSAVANFRFLSEEGRRVAAALLPLAPTSARTG
ncbi:7738_t:CDS:2 [Ambispora gerdemannii]|uniref:7738_t:CDS:1 n=1 Tax=Ambispora gerdemannii TaxID=144530 RepID=A0A9N9AMA3_9GLOM|nr:7738_t:CDS:2 [Ambispora gerdemannii]